MSSLSLKGKIFATVAAIGSAAAVAGLGTFGTFTDTTSASTDVDSGIVSLTLGSVAGTSDLSVAATDIVPGDTMYRRFVLDAATSTDPFSDVSMTSTATTSSLLNTDGTNGLQVKLEKCSLAWVADVTDVGNYTCGPTALGVETGTRSVVLADGPVIRSSTSLTNLASLTTAAASDDILMTMTLPTSAGNTFQNLASTIQFTFDATQRVATNK